MAKAALTPISFNLTRKFEELALFQAVHKSARFHTGLIDGEFTVEFDHAGEWIISDVAISTDNGKMGAQAESNVITLDADRDEPFYLVVLDALTAQYGETIPYWIDDELGHMSMRRAA